ncbi:MAG: SURF1 family protein [Pikeienuella sp.]
MPADNTNSEKGGAQRRPSSFRLLMLAFFGIGGFAVLTSLCVWQLQRLSWKEGLIAVLEQRLSAAPVAMPASPDPTVDEFARVTINGRFSGAEGAHGFVDAPLLTSLRPHGPGYRVIQPFDLVDGRRVMVDRGFAPVASKNLHGAASKPTPAPAAQITITGAMRWPVEGGEGQAYGSRDNVWINRDMAAMAELFGSEPILIIAETDTSVGEWPLPQQLRTVDIRNDHMEYAMTWASLALIWGVMTIVLWRRRG